MTFYSSMGCLHMHTTFSDGSGEVRDLALAAREAGLEWIWITDHDTLAGKDQEGIVEGVKVLIGYEITPDRNHFLVGNLPELVSRELPPADYVAEVARRGGVGVVAHPDERATHHFTEPYRWEDWTQRGFTGIELWNYMSDWIEESGPPRILPNILIPSLAIHGPTPETIAWWDELLNEGERPTGLFGVDAHAPTVNLRLREMTILSYRHCFMRLVNYLILDEPLSDEFATAEQQIWGAIRRGRVLMANRARGEAATASFLAQPRGGGALVSCGDEIAVGDGVTLDFDCPKAAELRLFHNGELVATSRRALHLRYDAHEAGHYRVEAWRHGSLWIMTNPIHLRDDAP